jgi:hypothetical protein
LEGRLRRQKETAASVTSSGIDRLKAVKLLSNDRAIGYNKHVKSLKLQHATFVEEAFYRRQTNRYYEVGG